MGITKVSARKRHSFYWVAVGTLILFDLEGALAIDFDKSHPLDSQPKSQPKPGKPPAGNPAPQVAPPTASKDIEELLKELKAKPIEGLEKKPIEGIGKGGGGPEGDSKTKKENPVERSSDDPPRLQDPITSESARAYLEANEDVMKKNPGGKVAFVRALPDSYLQNYVFMTETESAQDATCSEPRVIFQGNNFSPVFAVSTAKKDGRYIEPGVEMLEFDNKNPETAHFKYNLIHPGEKPPISINDQSCTRCHGSGFSARPNWDAYDSWANMLPFNRDRVYEGSEEARAMQRLYTKLVNDPIVGRLPLPPGMTRAKVGQNPDGTDKYEVKINFTSNEPVVEKEVEYEVNGKKMKKKVKQGGRFLTIQHSTKPGSDEGRGVGMFDKLTEYNAQRVAAQVRNSEAFSKVKYALKAVLSGCVKDEADFAKYIPQEQRDAAAYSLRFDKDGFEGYTKSLKARREALVDKKVETQKDHLRGMIQCNAEHYEGKRLGAEELEAKVMEELVRRNPAGFTVGKNGLLVDREVYSNNDELAKLLYVLKPAGVNTDSWSMGVNGDNDKRSRNYNFADLWSTYRSELRDLGKDLPNKCEDLAEASLRAYTAPVVRGRPAGGVKGMEGVTGFTH